MLQTHRLHVGENVLPIRPSENAAGRECALFAHRIRRITFVITLRPYLSFPFVPEPSPALSSSSLASSSFHWFQLASRGVHTSEAKKKKKTNNEEDINDKQTRSRRQHSREIPNRNNSSHFLLLFGGNSISISKNDMQLLVQIFEISFQGCEDIRGLRFKLGNLLCIPTPN